MKRKPTNVEMAEAPSADDLDGLRTDKQAAFCREYPKDFNATASAIRAGYSEATAYSIGSELLKKPEIRAAIARRMAAAADAAEVTAEMVIAELYQVATADSRELMRVEVDSCRHCYGIAGRREWTPAEYDRELRKATAEGRAVPEIEGGLAFDPRRPPVESCPECFGRGVDRVIITPSHKLSKGAAKLLASMRQTKDGIDLKTNDRMAALIALGKVRGIFVERQEHSGPNGAPLQLQPVAPRDPRSLTDDELRETLRAAGYPLLLEGGSK